MNPLAHLHDIREGTYTLPVLRALALPVVGEALRVILSGGADALQERE